MVVALYCYTASGTRDAASGTRLFCWLTIFLLILSCFRLFRHIYFISLLIFREILLISFLSICSFVFKTTPSPAYGRRCWTTIDVSAFISCRLFRILLFCHLFFRNIVIFFVFISRHYHVEFHYSLHIIYDRLFYNHYISN